jgi:hypothetical protein
MLAQDYIEPCDAPEPDGCTCEQALQATVDRLSRENHSLRDEISGLTKADRDGYTLAQDVLQAETLGAAKRKASIYLGLEQPF